MRGYGMHANSCVADQCESLRMKLRCMDANEWIGESFTDEFHVTEPGFETMLNVATEFCVVHFH